jgi:hypothetical protein
MNDELPPSLRHYGADLDAAIGRELGSRSHRRFREQPSRRRWRTAALATSAVVVAGLILTVSNGGGGVQFVAPAYAAFNGIQAALLPTQTARRISGGPPETVTSTLSLSWTNAEVTVTARTRTHEGHQITVQERIWHGKRDATPKPTSLTVVHGYGRHNQFAYLAYETIRGRRWQISGGRTKERGGSTVTIRLLSRFYLHRNPIQIVEIDSSGATQTYTITSSSRHHWRQRGDK